MSALMMVLQPQPASRDNGLPLLSEYEIPQAAGKVVPEEAKGKLVVLSGNNKSSGSTESRPSRVSRSWRKGSSRRKRTGGLGATRLGASRLGASRAGAKAASSGSPEKSMKDILAEQQSVKAVKEKESSPVAATGSKYQTAAEVSSQSLPSSSSSAQSQSFIANMTMDRGAQRSKPAPKSTAQPEECAGAVWDALAVTCILVTRATSAQTLRDVTRFKSFLRTRAYLRTNITGLGRVLSAADRILLMKLQNLPSKQQRVLLPRSLTCFLGCDHE